MLHPSKSIAVAGLSVALVACGAEDLEELETYDSNGQISIRVPAEWEPQAAIWMQWPYGSERSFGDELVALVATIIMYEDVHILVDDESVRQSAAEALIDLGGVPAAVVHDGEPTEQGFYIVWHTVGNDNSWPRDNGPLYVIRDGEPRIQNWQFNAWGGGFGDLPYAKDNLVPDWLGDYLGLPVDEVPYVHERGDTEFNGDDALILNWTVIGDPKRNPGITRDEVIDLTQEYFGVSRVVLVDGIPTGDGTRGHVDLMTRFISADEAVVANCTEASACKPGGHNDQIYDAAAEQLTEAGFTVYRWDFEGQVEFHEQAFDTNYLNWLVGNGFVITVGFGHPTADANAIAQLEEWFPGRDAHVVNMLKSWEGGGGVHCHTNDEPRFD